MSNETALDQGDPDVTYPAHGRVLRAKSFSLLMVMLACAFFGTFCFAPELMSVGTPFDVSLSIVAVPSLILVSIAISLTFVSCARANDCTSDALARSEVQS